MVLRMERARSKFLRWLRSQPDLPHGVAKDANVTPEAVRLWVNGSLPRTEALLRLRARRGLDINALVTDK